ncbi:MAG: transglycosylase SLT domain-containing protein [Mariprofundus sp.]
MRFILSMTVLVLLLVPTAQASTLAQQRDWFVQAQQALNAKQMDSYASLKAKLDGYPLTPYLEIWQARKQLASGDDDKVMALLVQYADIPESYDLRKAWIRDMADRGEWKRVARQLALNPGVRAKLPEIKMMADWHTGKQKLALQQFSSHWLHLNRLTDRSESLHRAWLKQGHPNIKERRSRIIRLAKHGKWKEIKTLSAPMRKQEKQWLAYWRKLQGDPQAQFSHWPASLSPPSARYMDMASTMIRDGLTRLARKDPVQAYQSLYKLRKRAHFGKHDAYFDVEARRIALRAAKRHMPVAAKWLAALPKALQNKEARGWLTRVYMLQHDWLQVLQSIQAMPQAEQKQARWQFWQGYALQATGREQQARSFFAGPATERGYYSFLSAERLGRPYHFGHKEINPLPERIRQLKSMPGIMRANEWLALGNENKAAREWSVALSGAGKKIWQAAALLATSWQWPDQGIRAAYRAGKMNALNIRFPLHFESDVMQAAKETGLAPASIWGVIRQESLFNKEARSPVGARGLMQLMPKTASMVARQMKLPGGHKQLFSANTNIRLGSRYLADMKVRFNDELALAAAAYNAGPGRVSKWLQRTPFDDEQVWVETIPFNETRRYVQHVLANATLYAWRSEQQARQLLAEKKTLALSLDERLEGQRN